MKPSRLVRCNHMDEQPELSTKSKTSIKFGCMSWPSVILTIAIIGIRAFQPNADPMNAWSGWSWFLMCLPIFLPFLIWLAVIFLAACTAFIGELFKRRY